MREKLIMAILEALPKLNVDSLNYINGVANGVILAGQQGDGGKNGKDSGH